MTARDFVPAHLDVAAFAKDSAELGGRWPLRAMPRLHEMAHGQTQPGGEGEIDWHASGELRQAKGSDGQVWLHVRASARLALVCQRCLGLVVEPVEVDRSFLFVPGEDAAAQLDADSEDDVLALTRTFDLRELIEDELLLALPLVPRHEVCPEPLPLVDDPVVEDDTPHPFAALAALKRGPPN